MTQGWKHGRWHLGLISCLAIASTNTLFSVDCACAQIVPDRTVGSVVTTPFRGIDVISGGATRGTNLFHSFSQFSVLRGRVAYFNNALSIQNIISRVTGASVSSINGLIEANGKANVFLINPNGIIFGPNASLYIGGSFVASTASSLKFADGTEFNAKAPQTSPLLTISVPVGLQFGTNPGDILYQSQATSRNGLLVQPGNTLALVGGNVSLDSGSLYAPGGRVELGGLAGAGTVGLNVDASNLNLSFPDGIPKADVSLTNGSTVNVIGGGGSIAVNARNLSISGGSGLGAGIASGSGAVGSKAGNIEIDATDTVTIESSSRIFNNVDQGSGTAGNILINTGTLNIIGNAQVGSFTGGQGNAGSVTIRARDQVKISGVNSGVDSAVDQSGVGNGSEINIQTRSLSLSNGAQVITDTLGQGNAGNIQINASDSVSISSGSQLEADTDGLGNAGNVSVQAGGTVSVNGVNSGISGSVAFSQLPGGIANDKGGNINIKARSLSVTEGAELTTSTYGRGDAGNVTVNASGPVSFDGVGSNGFSSGAFSRIYPGAIGKGGDVNIMAESLSLTNGGEIDSSTYGRGDTGSVTVNTSGTVFFDGVGSNGFVSGAFSAVYSGAIGKAGDVNVMAGSLSLTNGGEIDSSTSGRGDAGSVTVNASGPVSFDGVSSNGFVSGAFSAVYSGAIGKGGDINIMAGSLSLTNGARSAVSSFGQGNAGNLQIQAGTVTLDGGSSLGATTASTEGGNINLKAQDLLLLRHGSQISATAGTAKAGGNGGNITLNTPLLVAIPQENSDISANAFTGNGGQITVNATGVFGLQFQKFDISQSDITASSQFGVNGTVNINTPNVNPSNGLVTLPAVVVDPSRLIAQGCGADGGTNSSQFTVTGRGGLPPNPGAVLSRNAVLADTRLPTTTAAPQRSATVTPASPKLSTLPAPATGAMFNGLGQVTLIAATPTARLEIPWLAPHTCHVN